MTERQTEIEIELDRDAHAGMSEEQSTFKETEHRIDALEALMRSRY
jgi:hypothetical protein